jgi:hypothetical protein
MYHSRTRVAITQIDVTKKRWFNNSLRKII